MIYFDNASTCFLNDKDIFNYFLRCNKNFSSNPNSNYKIGYFANKALNETRKKIIDLLQLDFQKYDVIFNSGATEGINHALKGYALKNKNRGNEIISFINEHTAVLPRSDTHSRGVSDMDDVFKKVIEALTRLS